MPETTYRFLFFLLLLESVRCFKGVFRQQLSSRWIATSTSSCLKGSDGENFDDVGSEQRRNFLMRSSVAVASALPVLMPNPEAKAAVGTLPEFQDTNVVVQGVTVKVTDPSQQRQMIQFLQDAFDFKVLRSTPDGANTWLGFGPEEMRVPDGFQIPVSSFNTYGGHASIHLQYDAQATSAYYRGDGSAPGDNIAYLQVGVPTYRVSQMVKNGGNLLDAFGIVDVISPSGLPMRGIIGISPDPIMFCAINCKDIKQSKSFYQQLGFTEQEYPYCRLNKGKGQFEPPQPSGSIYMAPSPNSMGVLLLPSSNKKKIIQNAAVDSLNLVYTPSSGGGGETQRLVDPSGVGIGLVAYSDFEATERATRVPS